MANTTKFVTDTVENVGSTQITITEDKLRNILLKHVPMIRKSRDWIGAFFTTAGLSASIYACDFTGKLGLSADKWEGIFFVLILLGILFFLYSFINAFRKNSNEEMIIKDIKTVEGQTRVLKHFAYGVKLENRKFSFFKDLISADNDSKQAGDKQ